MMNLALLRKRRILVALAAGITLLALALWQFFGRDVISVRIDMPGPATARVYVEVNGSYRDGHRYETRNLIRQYVPANQRVSFRIQSAAPWRFESLSVRIAHPGMLTIVQTKKRNPHWWRVSIHETPAVLSASPDSDSVAVSEIERHYEMVEDLFIRPLGLREAAVQAWPHLRSMHALFIAVSFRLEGQADLAAELKSERLLRLSDRWVALERLLRSAEFLPCTVQGVSFVIGEPGVAPGCGLKPVQYR